MQNLIFSLIGALFVSISTCSMSNAQSTTLIPREVLFSNPEKTNPQISPDGTKLAYCAPVNNALNILTKTIGKNDDALITNEQRSISMYWWAPDSKKILYLQDSNGDENYHLYGVNLENNQVRDYTPFNDLQVKILAIDKNFPDTILIQMNKESKSLFDVYALNLETGALSLKAKNPGNIFTWLADTMFNVRAAIAVYQDGKQSLLVRDNEDSEFCTLLDFYFEDTIVDDLYCGLLGFSKDGTHIYLNTSLGINTRSLLMVNTQTGNHKVLARDIQYDISQVLFDNDSYAPKIIRWDKERTITQAYDPNFKNDFEQMNSISDGDLNFIQHNDDSSQWILGFLHDNKSYEYYHYSSTTKQATFLFYTRPKLNEYSLAHMKPISYTTRDGLTIHGYLSSPTQKNHQKLPLVLYVHGGPFMRDTWGYSSVVQWLVNRGYACLQVNYRGSSGYGKTFLSAGNGEWGNKMQHDLEDAVQWAIDQGIADPKRIAIFGGSYGGYAALVGATFTPNLFCCAIDYVGPSNLITVLHSLPPYWSLAQWERRIGKISDEEFLKSRSPLFYIDAIKIPIFIAHGANDVRVTVAESEQLVNALKQKGLAYEYLVFEDEGHGFVQYKNRMIFYQAIEKFLAKHLSGYCEN